jgi:CobQ-like glutamine amidotransferase family enzyme
VADLELRVLWLYPEHMNIYADRGNISVLERRCAWRGIDFRLDRAGPGDPVEPGRHDFLYIGGGQDRDQALVARDLAGTKREPIAEAVAQGAVLLAVCGGYREPGPRLIGNVLIEVDFGDGPERIAGFENHGGRTYLGADERALGTVVSGFGNNGRDRLEGVRRDRLIGTYLHGPLLPKNVRLADRLIEWALEYRLDQPLALEPLDDSLECAAHETAVRAALSK